MPNDPEALLAHADFVKRMAERLVAGDTTADDIVQETYLAALRRPPRDGSSNVRGWLATVARNAARMLQRSEGRRARHEQRALPADAPPSPAEMAARVELHRQVVTIVLALDEPYRHALLLRYFQDLSAREIAARLELPLNTVRTRLQRALAQVRARLDDEHGGDRSAWCVTLVALAAGPRPPAAATGIPGSAMKGVLTMTAKTKIAALALLAACAGLVFVLTATRHGNEPASRSGGAGRLAAARPNPDGAAHTEAVQVPPADRDRDVFGVVVDERGAPVVGALVRVFRYPLRALRWAVENPFARGAPGPSSTSRPDGSFAVRLAWGDVVHVRITAEGFAPFEASMIQAGERLRVVLTRGVSIRVRVMNHSHVPLRGARVAIDGDWTNDNPSFLREALTDTAGEVTLATLPRCDGAWMNVEQDGYARVGLWIPLAGPSDRIDVVLDAGRRIRGHVTDAATGRPIEGATVRASDYADRVTRTDARGSFSLDGLAAAELEVSALGYGQQQRSTAEGGVVNFALRRGVTVRGRVLDADGGVLRGALIGVFSSGDMAQLQPGGTRHRTRRNTVSGADGRFFIHDVNPTWSHTLLIDANGHARGSYDFTPDSSTAGEPMQLGDIRLERAHALELRIVNESGAPVGRVKCRLAPRRESSDAVLRPSMLPFEDARFSDDLGRVRFPELAAGSYVATIRRSGSPDVSHKIRIDELLTNVEVVVEELVTVTVVVVDGAGRPVEGIQLCAYGPKPAHIWKSTDGRGRAVFKVTHGNWRVNVSGTAGGRRFLRLFGRELPLDKGEVRISVAEAFVARGLIVDPLDTPLAGVEVHLLRDGKLHRGVFSNGQGEFEFLLGKRERTMHLLVTGRVQRRIGLADEVEVGLERRTWDSVAVSQERITLRVRPIRVDRSLLVRVLDPDGVPLVGAEIKTGIRGAKPAQTDGAGRLSLDGLPARELRMTARLPKGHARRREMVPPVALSVTPAGQQVELRFRRSVAIALTVLTKDGAPVEGAFASMREAGLRLDSVRTNEVGAARLLAPVGGKDLVVRVTYPDSGRWSTIDTKAVHADVGRVEVRLP